MPRRCAIFTVVMKHRPPLSRPAPPRIADDLPAASAVALLAEEEIVGRAFRGGAFAELRRDLLFVQEALFSGCLFAGSRLRRAHFTDVVFRNCDLSNADWSGCSFQRVEWVDCKLLGADLSSGTWHDVRLVRPAAPYLALSGGRLRRVAFEEATLRGAAFADCRFEAVDFRGCDLTEAEFAGTRLGGVSLADSQIGGLRVRAVASPELRGVRVSPAQACELARLLGVEIEEP